MLTTKLANVVPVRNDSAGNIRICVDLKHLNLGPDLSIKQIWRAVNVCRSAVC